MGVPKEIQVTIEKPTPIQRNATIGTPAPGHWECVPVVTETVHKGPHPASEPKTQVPEALPAVKPDQ